MTVDVQPPEIPEVEVKKSKKSKSRDKEIKEASTAVENTASGGLYVTVLVLFPG